MAIKVKYSTKYWAVQKRIARLPTLVLGLLSAIRKKDASRYIKNFHDGIKNKSFRLKKLERGTIIRKERMGMEFPRTPLYGRGDDKKDRSYVNMMRMRKLKNGWRVKPSIAKHYSGKVKLRTLFFVHEFGAIIKQGEKMIRIPPRPAALKAFNKTLKQEKKQENAPLVKKAINKYINTGREQAIFQQKLQLEKGLNKFEE
jgi:hypothetical protein